MMFTLNLTPDQQALLHQASRSEAVPVFDPGENRTYFLVPADLYQRLCGEHDIDAGVEHLYPVMDEVARREGWDDPEMDAYDQLDPRKTT